MSVNLSLKIEGYSGVLFTNLLLQVVSSYSQSLEKRSGG
jgi:hypothetical protein